MTTSPPPRGLGPNPAHNPQPKAHRFTMFFRNGHTWGGIFIGLIIMALVWGAVEVSDSDSPTNHGANVSSARNASPPVAPSPLFSSAQSPSPNMSDAPSPSSTPTTTPAPSASASSVPTPQSCVSVPRPGIQIVSPLYLPAGGPAALDELRNLRGSAYSGFSYAGVFVEAPVFNTWGETAKCNGLAPYLSLDNVFSHFGANDNQVIDYISRVKVNADGGWLLSMNLVPIQPLAEQIVETNRRISVIRKAGSGAHVTVTGDVNIGSIAALKALKADIFVPIYLPWEHKSDDAALNWPVENYPLVGVQAMALNGKDAMGGVQAMDMSGYGFARSSQPSPHQVGEFMKMVADAGAKNAYIYTEEDKANSADDPVYLGAVAGQVKDKLVGR